MFGKSIQDGVPSTESPVQIETAGDEGDITVKIEGDGETQTLTLQTPNGLPGIPVKSDGNYTDSSGQQWICDEIDLERGKYVQRVKRYLFDGSEDEKWRCIPSSVKPEHMIVDIRLERGKYIYETPLMSNRAKFKTWSVNDTYLFLNNYEYLKWFDVDHAELFENIEVFRKWLSENPLELIYQLETIIERDLTKEEIQQCKQLHTNYPITIISNDAGADMELIYTLDTKTYVDTKITDISRVVIAQKGI